MRAGNRAGAVLRVCEYTDSSDLGMTEAGKNQFSRQCLLNCGGIDFRDGVSEMCCVLKGTYFMRLPP